MIIEAARHVMAAAPHVITEQVVSSGTVASRPSETAMARGAPIDAIVIAGHQPEWLGDTEIKEREAAMLSREKSLLKQILVPPFSSSASWP